LFGGILRTLKPLLIESSVASGCTSLEEVAHESELSVLQLLYAVRLQIRMNRYDGVVWWYPAKPFAAIVSYMVVFGEARLPRDAHS
jgi:hypothetical protein